MDYCEIFLNSSVCITIVITQIMTMSEAV